MRHSRVRKTEWIEQQFLMGFSIREFTPAPYEMDEHHECVTRRPLREDQRPGPDEYLPPVDEHFNRLFHESCETEEHIHAGRSGSVGVTSQPSEPRAGTFIIGMLAGLALAAILAAEFGPRGVGP
jgi:hypothetical protein